MPRRAFVTMPESAPCAKTCGSGRRIAYAFVVGGAVAVVVQARRTIEQAWDDVIEQASVRSAVLGHVYFAAADTRWGAVATRWALDAGMDPNARDMRGLTALGVAALLERPDVAAILLARGAGVDRTDSRGRSALHLTATNARTSVLRLLLDHGANPNAVACDGHTPLHDAARCENLAAVRMLVAAGADVYARDRRGRRPKKLALCPETKAALMHRIEKSARKLRRSLARLIASFALSGILLLLSLGHWPFNGAERRW